MSSIAGMPAMLLGELGWRHAREALAPVQCAQMIETSRGAGYRLAQVAPAEPA